METTKQLQKRVHLQQPYTAEGVMQQQNTIKDLFVYYTGITYITFLCLLSFLFPTADAKVHFGRSDTISLTNVNALFLVLCRLRHDMGLKDFARFGLSLQSMGIFFNIILEMTCFKL